MPFPIQDITIPLPRISKGQPLQPVKRGKKLKAPSTINIGKMLRETTITLSFKDILDECLNFRREVLGKYRAKKKLVEEVPLLVKHVGESSLNYLEINCFLAKLVLSDCIIDNRSVVNGLNYDIFTKLGLVIMGPSTTNLSLVDNRTIYVEGVVEDVHVIVVGMTTLVTFHVLTLSDGASKYPLLLGRPWIKQMDCAIDLPHQRLIFVHGRFQVILPADIPSHGEVIDIDVSSKSWSSDSKGATSFLV